MTVLAGPFVIAVALMGAAGAAKALSPAGTSGALRALGLPHRQTLVRAGGAVELLVAIGALATGSAALAFVVAVSYAAFAVFVAAALRAGSPVSSCGCLGKLDTPPHLLHVALNAAGAVVALVATIDGGIALRDVLDAQPGAGIPFLFLTAVGVALTSAVMSVLPRALRAAKEVS